MSIRFPLLFASLLVAAAIPAHAPAAHGGAAPASRCQCEKGGKGCTCPKGQCECPNCAGKPSVVGVR